MELSYPNSSIMELEDYLNTSVTEMLVEVASTFKAGKLPKLKIMVAFLWAGLMEKNDVKDGDTNRPINFNDVANNFRLKDVDSLMVPAIETLSEALDFGDLPKGEQAKKK